MTAKTCTRCGETKPLDEFSICRRNRDGRQTWCKACHHERRVRRANEVCFSRAYYEALRRLRQDYRAEFDHLYEQAKQRHGADEVRRARAYSEATRILREQHRDEFDRSYKRTYKWWKRT